MLKPDSIFLDLAWARSNILDLIVMSYQIALGFAVEPDIIVFDLTIEPVLIVLGLATSNDQARPNILGSGCRIRPNIFGSDNHV